MPEMLWLIVVAVVGVAVGFVISRYLVNASSKKAAEEAEQLVSDAKRQAETLRREAVVEAKMKSSDEAGGSGRKQRAYARGSQR